MISQRGFVSLFFGFWMVSHLVVPGVAEPAGDENPKAESAEEKPAGGAEQKGLTRPRSYEPPPKEIMDNYNSMTREQKGIYWQWARDFYKANPSYRNSDKRYPFVETAIDAIKETGEAPPIKDLSGLPPEDGKEPRVDPPSTRPGPPRRGPRPEVMERYNALTREQQQEFRELMREAFTKNRDMSPEQRKKVTDAAFEKVGSKAPRAPEGKESETPPEGHSEPGSTKDDHPSKEPGKGPNPEMMKRYNALTREQQQKFRGLMREAFAKNRNMPKEEKEKAVEEAFKAATEIGGVPADPEQSDRYDALTPEQQQRFREASRGMLMRDRAKFLEEKEESIERAFQYALEGGPPPWIKEKLDNLTGAQKMRLEIWEKAFYENNPDFRNCESRYPLVEEVIGSIKASIEIPTIPTLSAPKDLELREIAKKAFEKHRDLPLAEREKAIEEILVKAVGEAGQKTKGLTEEEKEEAVQATLETMWARKKIRSHPDDSNSYNDLGCALDNLGNYDDAASAFRRALELAPDDALFHLNLALVLGRRGRLGESIQSFRRSIELDPDHAAAHSGLGGALELQGRFDEAIEAFRISIALNPNDTNTQEALRRVIEDL